MTLAATLMLCARGRKSDCAQSRPSGLIAALGKYREATNALNKIMIVLIVSGNVYRTCGAILEGLAGRWITLAIFDTAGSDTSRSSGNRCSGNIAVANAPNALGCSRDGGNISSRLPGKAQSCLRP